MKTRALQILDALHIGYDVREFEEEELTAEEAARKLQLPLEMVFKTLVLRGNTNGILLACIPGTHELSLKKIARTSGNKIVEMVRLEEVHKLTGYHRGGCSPLGARKEFPVYIDERIILLEKVCVSAGMRGMQMIVSPDDLIRAARAYTGDLTD